MRKKENYSKIEVFLYSYIKFSSLKIHILLEKECLWWLLKSLRNKKWKYYILM